MLSLVVKTLRKKGFIRLYKAVDNDYTNWVAVGDLDFANDRTAYMMECPNLVFVGDQPVLLYCPQGLDKSVLDYDNIYPNMYKIGASFDPEKAKMVDVSELHNLDYGFEAYATQGFNAPDGRAYAVSWLGLPDVSIQRIPMTIKELSLVKELTIKDESSTNTQLKPIKDLRAESEEFANKAQTKNCYELELQFEKDSQNEIVLFADAEGKGLDLTFEAKGLITVDRSQAGEQYAQEFGTSRSCSIANQATTANIFIDNSILKSLSIKEKKSIFWSGLPHADQNGILIKSGTPTGTYYELIMVAKLTDVAKLAGVSPTTVSRVINKKGYLSEKRSKSPRSHARIGL